MVRRAKPFLHEGWYKTEAGGPPRTKLCRAELGFAHAELCLARWQVRILEVKERGVLPAGMTPAGYLQRLDEGDLELPDGRTLIPLAAPSAAPSPAQTNPTLVGPKVYLLGEVHDAFLDFKRLEADPATYEHYVNKLKPLLARFGNRPLTSLTEEDGLAFRRWLHTERVWTQGTTKRKRGVDDRAPSKVRKREGMAPCSVNHHLRAAKSLFNWAAKPKRQAKYGLPSNPWVDVKLLAEQGRERLITDDEFASLLRHCRDQDFQTLLVLRNTTLRPGELRKMEWDFVRFDSHQIVFPPHLIKTRSRRAVTMIETVEEVLRGRKERVEQEKGRATGLVFPGARGEMWKPGSFTQKFRRLRERCVKAGEIEREKAGERLVLYSARHTRITEMYVQGNDTPVVMRDSGHKTHAMAERYKHLSASFVADNIRRRAKDSAPKSDGGGSGKASQPG